MSLVFPHLNMMLRGDGTRFQSAGSVAKSPSLKNRHWWPDKGAGVELTCLVCFVSACCTNTRNRLGNGYLNQGIGYNVEYIGQGIGRANENFEMLNKVHQKTPRDPEKETRNRFGIGCNVDYFGQGTGMANGNVDMFNNVDPDIQRAFEKKKIREEIIAGEIVRRRELEAEVREELRIERELALRMKGVNTFDRVCVSMEPCGKSSMQEVEGLSLVDNIVMPLEESLRIQGRTQTSRMENIVKPFQLTSIESKVDETGQEKEKNIFLAKPSADLPPAKESAYTVFGVRGVGNIEGKKLWTESKHRSKRAVLKAEKRAATAITGETVQISGIEPTPPPIANAKPLNGHGNKNSSSKEKGKEWPENKNKEKGKEKFAFWCKMCNVGANNKYVMETHEKGMKHLEKLQKKFPFWCDMCKVGTYVAHIMEAHLKGRKHLTTLQEKAASTTSAQGKLASKIV